MNLISCDGCGGVFDKNKLKFPEEFWIYDKEGVAERVDNSKALWNGDEFVAYINCPICNEAILEDI